MSAARSLSALPPRAAESNGYVYVLQFSNKTVKVGSTANPARRFYSHNSEAKTFGHTIRWWWISQRIQEFSAVEDALIDFAHSLARRSVRREYFQGVNYADVRDHAAELVQASVEREAPNVCGVACTAELAEALKDHSPLYPLAEVSAVLDVELADLEAGCENGEIDHVRLRSGRLMDGRRVRELAARLAAGGDLYPDVSPSPVLRRRVNPDDSWLVSA